MSSTRASDTAEMTMGERSFHVLAVKLLRKMLTEVANVVPSRYWKDNEKWLIEASRILASNCIIARYMGLELDEVNKDPNLGLTRLSISSPRISESEILTTLRTIQWSKQLGFPLQEYNLTPYELARLLVAIHEVAVYGKLELINDGTLQVELDESEVKRRLGAFYTPVKVTRFICEHTLGYFLDEKIGRLFSLLKNRGSTNSKEILHCLDDILAVTMIDPACGPGTFLIELLMVIKSRYSRMVEILEELEKSTVGRDRLGELRSLLKNESSFLRYFKSRVYGVDLDPAAIEVASICLSFISGETNLKSSLDVNLKQGDSLISELPLGFVKPSPEELKKLRDLRRSLAVERDVKEKEKLSTEFKKSVAQIQRRKNAPNVIRADQFFPESRKKEFICWELEFPEVFYPVGNNILKGFDILTMNPPYDNLKLNVSEFKSTADRVKIKEFKEARRRECEYFRRSGHYKLSNSGMLNYYRIMLERALIMTSSSSLLGFIIPSTFLCDRSASKIRREVLLKYKALGIFDFPERARVFQGVNQAVCIVLLDKSRQGEGVPLASNLSDLSELGRTKPTVIPVERIKTAFPTDFAIPKTTEEGWDILEKIHYNPQLSEISWIRNLRGEVDLTMYKDCLSASDTGSPLVRGSCITRFFLKWTPDKRGGFIVKDRFLRKLGRSEKVKHIDEVRIVGQQVSNMMQRWRLKFCLVPPGTFLGNSCNYIIIEGYEGDVEPLRLYLLGLLNSHLLNWRFKLTSTNNHVNNYELGSLPIKLIDWANPSEVKLFNLIVQGVRQILQVGKVTPAISRVEAAIFLLYHLTLGEVRFVLESQGCEEPEVEAILKCLLELKEAIKND